MNEHTMTQSPNKKPLITPKDFFLYISVTVFLYLSAISFLIFIFAVVNIAFPETSSYYNNDYDMVRTGLSLLVVSFPIFIFLTRKVNNYLHKNEDERENGVRKWLIYFTLFITAITSAITLVVLLNYFLEGDLTTRFAIKVVAVLAVTALVFWFYKKDLQGAWYTNPKKSRMVGYMVSTVVFASIVAGFVLVGSPAEQRRIRNDETRIQHLQSIQFAILEHWRNTETLPISLETLDDPLNYHIIEHDPVTGEEYTYRVLDGLIFELCATFESVSLYTKDISRTYPPMRERGLMLDDNWEHEVGQECFERTIDPELHKQIR
jgi:hypothetical protein